MVRWIGLTVVYVFSGFDQPFFGADRLFGVGLVVPRHWLDWHLPTIGLVLTLVLSAALLLDGTEDGSDHIGEGALHAAEVQQARYQ